MAQDVTIAGASFEDVPGILVPKTSSGTAYFADTSDADATAGDIASGKTAYVNGVKLTGTGSGGGGGYFTVTDTTDAAGGTVRTITPTSGTAVIQTGKSVTITSNTTTNVTPDTGYTALAALQIVTNVSGGGGSGIYEEGAVSLSSDKASVTISFTNTHTTAPIYVGIYCTTATDFSTISDSTAIEYFCENTVALLGAPIAQSSTATRYGAIMRVMKASTGLSTTTNYISSSTSTAIPTTTGFTAAVTGGWFRSGQSYKWVAVWKS